MFAIGLDQDFEIGLTSVLPHMTNTNILRSDGSGCVRLYYTSICYQIKVSCCFGVLEGYQFCSMY
jgi:hypothetical protein